ncbi:hypothetical protein L226DRAFT_608239 [Lentinus tigrinus ALCF2SS1-7]|uniref:Transmembrane protein n=1 Tax=Lentinus tigrinus ALCF2SS1-6 TaxID=1328759 RepID=A0A5C2SSZ4_9APHY|nr:hypothetical protein L227DRAFT_648121 [Lentinus tigrinus ALCF2SS1-6]RPD80916.1 hypothetical protein L226DRAFT_608239 [Lentinus tigrinus ALCF2SS1-7]
MRPRWSGLTCFFAFVLCFQFALALPAETGTSTLTSHSPSSTAEDSRPTARTSESRSITPAADDHGDSDDSHSSTQASHRTSSSHSLAIPIPHTHTPHSWSHSLNYTGTHTFLPHPPPTGPVGGSPPRSSHGQSAVAIVFEVLGGAVVLLIVLAIARCWYSYRRTPPRDRIGALLSRHQLEREMEEQQRDRMERINRAMEPYRWRPPPPPYQPAPAYDAVVATDSPEGSIDWGRPSFPSASHPRSPTP